MPNPLDYFNPQADHSGAKPRRVGPVTAVPAEFDAPLTTTNDHAAARAILTALAKLGIGVFQATDGDLVNRRLTLHVRHADHTRAATVASEIFARRAKVKTLLPKKSTTEPDMIFSRSLSFD